MRTSEQTDLISAALSKAQKELEPVPKDAANPYFNSRYATLAACRHAARDVLAKHDLAVIQGLTAMLAEKAVGITTRLTHKSGQFFEETSWCVPKDMGPQSVGGAATYLERYGFNAIVGLSSEDDDGNEATTGKSAQAPQKSYTAPTPRQSAPVADVVNGTNHLNSPGEYVIKFGKHKDKKLASLSQRDLETYVEWLQKNTKDKGEPMSKNAAEFIANAEAYVDQLIDAPNPVDKVMAHLSQPTAEDAGMEIPF